jgi:tRNA A-37 threonylcarbamoyl transferase component Bud32
MSQPARPAAADDVDLSGRTIGDFRLLRRLGRGAMAEVYLAEQQSLRRQVAFKVLKASLAGDAGYVQRFQNEGRAAASLVHANIVQIYEVGCAEGVHYLAQEYVPGVNLREWIQRSGPLDTALAVAVMRQTAAALHKAAQAGIIHRDVKPENLMLSKTGEVKVADFGLARIARDDDVLHLTQVGITMGTPLYMSPEQVEGKPLDSRSDLYSFGVTCYHLLGGEPPFQGATALSVAVQHLNAAPRRLEELRPDLPPGLCRIVHRLMEKKPSERYHSAADVLRELRTLPVTAGDDPELWAATAVELAALDPNVAAGLKSAVDRLDEMMKTSALVLRKRDAGRRRWLVAAAVAFVLGGVAAIVNARRTPPLLAGMSASDAVRSVPKQPSAQTQFLAAQMQLTDSEAWLQSVEQYYPNDAYFVGRAKQELARLYWQENRLDEAMTLFTEFAGRLEAEYKAFGLAGESLVLTKRGNLEQAAQKLVEVLPLRTKLDPRMSQDLEYALAANRRALQQRGVAPSEPAASRVPRQDSAEAQLYFARMQLGDAEKEEALKGVSLHYAQDAYYVGLAKQELVKLYLQQHRWKNALPICLELAEQSGDDRSATAVGLLGQAIVGLRTEQTAQAVAALKKLQPLQDVVDPTLAALLVEAFDTTKTRLPADVGKALEAWRAQAAAKPKP